MWDEDPEFLAQLEAHKRDLDSSWRKLFVKEFGREPSKNDLFEFKFYRSYDPTSLIVNTAEDFDPDWAVYSNGLEFNAVVEKLIRNVRCFEGTTKAERDARLHAWFSLYNWRKHAEGFIGKLDDRRLKAELYYIFWGLVASAAKSGNLDYESELPKRRNRDRMPAIQAKATAKNREARDDSLKKLKSLLERSPKRIRTIADPAKKRTAFREWLRGRDPGRTESRGESVAARSTLYEYVKLLIPTS